MDTQFDTSSESKQITIDVPHERLPEFYAFFGRFLAGGAGRGRRGRHARGTGHHGHHCGHHRVPESAGAEPATAEPPAGTTSI